MKISMPANTLKRQETGLLSAISVEFEFNVIMEFCIAEQWAAGLFC